MAIKHLQVSNYSTWQKDQWTVFQNLEQQHLNHSDHNHLNPHPQLFDKTANFNQGSSRCS